MHVSAGNPFRRWPAEHFAAVAAALAREDPARRIIITLWAIGARSGGCDRGGGAGSAPATAAAQIVRCGEFDLSELRALVGRAALYIGGDSGPLHIAATTERADRRAVRPDAAGTVAAVADAGTRGDRGRRRAAAVPAVPSAALRARRLPLFDARSTPEQVLAAAAANCLRAARR